MAKKSTARQPGADRILDAVLELCAERRWRDVTMEAIAEAAGASLQRVHECFPTRPAILAGLMVRTDKVVLAGHDFADSGEPYRERLLDVLMRRFEALTPNKAAIRSIFRDIGADPATAVCSLPAFANSMAWSLEAAGIRASGPMGLLRIKGLGLIYLSALRVWFDDDSPDLSATMARLDRDLRRAEAFVTAFPGRKRARQDAS
ncbi:MAG: hypothetical protein ACPGRZ_15310 [Alphaproteobacteria bacterium]